MRASAAAFAAAALLACFAAHADCFKNIRGETVCGKGKCEADYQGRVFCAPAGGDAMRDRYGVVHCGVGSCVADAVGKLWCSKEVGGGAAADMNGNPKCLGGCEEASQQKCEAGK